MPTAVYTPRVNNNDDHVQVRSLDVAVGDQIEMGESLGAVETDKAVVEIEAESSGYIIYVSAEEGDKIEVGTVLMWIGEEKDEPVPELTTAETTSDSGGSAAPTAKARLMAKKLGVALADIPYQGDRLGVADVVAFAESKGMSEKPAPSPSSLTTAKVFPPPASAGSIVDMTPEQKGMLNTVTWHRDQAVTGYIELEYETADWENYADEYAKEHKLLLSPLISLMAYRLVEIVKDNPLLNSTIHNDELYRYNKVNLGFTVQVGKTLYLPVIQSASDMNTNKFLLEMGDIQRKANGHKLSVDQLEGATVAFSSMARWQICRHAPILPPYCSLIIAHTVTKEGKSILGATYDHRVLSGFDVTMTLKGLSKPPQA